MGKVMAKQQEEGKKKTAKGKKGCIERTFIKSWEIKGKKKKNRDSELKWRHRKNI